MSLGAIFVGIAVAVVTIAYIARPFRAAAMHTPASDVDRLIETWVRAIADVSSSTTRTGINFCPQCGRQVAPDHRFCPGCGKRLPVNEDVA